ncbi:hypothetical protein DY926_13330 [Komagataeibacter melaceti]|uniref:Uncharacterized protein n=1 Tax=Komagataeibacter melaceti TaxID=2766577 RepID=A0A371YXR9_9PROT|nr:hypothetical protein DY926_13330 [Komagataeibacter melaceti]
MPRAGPVGDNGRGKVSIWASIMPGSFRPWSMTGFFTAAGSCGREIHPARAAGFTPCPVPQAACLPDAGANNYVREYIA